MDPGRGFGHVVAGAIANAAGLVGGAATDLNFVLAFGPLSMRSARPPGDQPGAARPAAGQLVGPSPIPAAASTQWDHFVVGVERPRSACQLRCRVARRSMSSDLLTVNGSFVLDPVRCLPPPPLPGPAHADWPCACRSRVGCRRVRCRVRAPCSWSRSRTPPVVCLDGRRSHRTLSFLVGVRAVVAGGDGRGLGDQPGAARPDPAGQLVDRHDPPA